MWEFLKGLGSNLSNLGNNSGSSLGNSFANSGAYTQPGISNLFPSTFNNSTPGLGTDTLNNLGGIGETNQSLIDPTGFFSRDSLLGNREQAGILPTAAGLGSGIASIWSARNSNDQANRMLDLNEEFMRANQANTAKAYNNELSRKQGEALKLSSGVDVNTPEGQAQLNAALDEYMAKYGINS